MQIDSQIVVYIDNRLVNLLYQVHYIHEFIVGNNEDICVLYVHVIPVTPTSSVSNPRQIDLNVINSHLI